MEQSVAYRSISIPIPYRKQEIPPPCEQDTNAHGVAQSVEIRVYQDSEVLAHGACNYLLEAIHAYAQKQNMVHVAFSGGSTPKRMFELMVSDPYLSRFPWQQMRLFFVDERMVPADHPDSNYRMFTQAIQGKVRLESNQLIRIQGELEPQEAAALYSEMIQTSFRDSSSSFKKHESGFIPIFDIVQLGMGEDGHTASLFPHTSALHVQDQIAIANYVPKFDTWRVTLTKTVIQHAKEVFFLIGGRGKADVLREVLEGEFNPETYPTQWITSVQEHVTLLVDEDAARNL